MEVVVGHIILLTPGFSHTINLFQFSLPDNYHGMELDACFARSCFRIYNTHGLFDNICKWPNFLHQPSAAENRRAFGIVQAGLKFFIRQKPFYSYCI